MKILNIKKPVIADFPTVLVQNLVNFKETDEFKFTFDHWVHSWTWSKLGIEISKYERKPVKTDPQTVYVELSSCAPDIIVKWDEHIKLYVVEFSSQLSFFLGFFQKYVRKFDFKEYLL